MKRLSIIFSVILMSAACQQKSSNTNEKQAAVKENKETIENIVAKKDLPSSDTVEENTALKSADILAAEVAPGSCSIDSDCFLVPLSGCFGCVMGESSNMKAVAQAEFQQIMESNRQQCEPKFKKLMEDAQNTQGSNIKPTATCNANFAKCVSNSCTAVTLSDAELKSKMDELMKDMPNDQQGGEQDFGEFEDNMDDFDM